MQLLDIWMRVGTATNTGKQGEVSLSSVLMGGMLH
jgi:hypothetical protein